LCEKCGRSDEIEDVKLDRLLQEAARRAGFAPHRQMVELVGLCRDCAA
jgi:Fur family transcriptional regulator, zinc uptake regulator